MRKIWILAAALFLAGVLGAEAAQVTPSELSYLTQGGDLSFGSKGPRVVILQKFLAAENNAHPGIYPEGTVSGYFGALTRRALGAWQAMQGITPASGYFGAKTRLAAARSGSEAPTGNLPALNSTLPAIPDSAMKIGANPNYQTDFVTALATSKIPAETLANLSSAYGAMVPVPTIAEALGKDLASGDFVKIAADKQALAVWDRYFANLAARFAAITVPAENKEKHRALLAWLKYNRDFIAQMQSAGAADAVSSANQTYSKIYFSNHDLLIGGLQSAGGVMAAAPAETKEYSLLGSLRNIFASMNPHLNRAHADNTTPTGNSTSTDTEEGQYNMTQEIVKEVVQGVIQRIFLTPFGGKIAITDVCTTGELLTITGPGSGGQFFLYWGVYAYNPFPYKVVSPGNQTIGMAFNYPGICNKALVTYPEGQGFVLFFGTSKTPAG